MECPKSQKYPGQKYFAKTNANIKRADESNRPNWWRLEALQTRNALLESALAGMTALFNDEDGGFHEQFEDQLSIALEKAEFAMKSNKVQP